jgi:2-keto-3-deoxy-L-rhamnonate aldolase RhmA
MIIHNTFRDLLDQDKPTVGTHFMLLDPDIPELIGDTELFDYGEFTAEYTSLDMPMLYNLARAGQCGRRPLPLMIKPDMDGQGFWTQAALGAGFKAVLFTDIRSPEDIDEAHRIIRPDIPDVRGHMGVKLRRPALNSYDTEEYLKDMQSIVFCVMFEKDIALENIDAILERAKEKGVDMTQWGPADFSFSRGEPQLQGSKEIRVYEEKVIAKSLEYGIQPRIEIAAVEQAKRYIDLGVKHFCIGWDRFMIRQQLAQLGSGMKKLVEDL